MEGKPRKRDIIEFSDSDSDCDEIKDDKIINPEPIQQDIKHKQDDIKQAEPIQQDIKQAERLTKELTKTLKDSNIGDLDIKSLSDEDRAVLKQIIKQNNEILQQLNIEKAEKETKKQVKEQKRLLALEEQKREKQLEKIELHKLVLQREHDIKTAMNNNFNAQLIRTRRGLLG